MNKCRRTVTGTVLICVLAGVMPAFTQAPDSMSAAHPAEILVLAENGSSDYRIVVSQAASPSERHAALELQAFLERIAGARLPIVTDTEPPSDHEILLGDSTHLGAAGVTIDFAGLGDEGYVIRTAGSRLIIAGGRQRGTLYGVYGLLEEHLGCRWFTPAVERIPTRTRLQLGPIDEREVPALEYREVFYFTALDGDWAARNRLNSANARLTEDHGGRVTYYPFVHSFFTLIPPDTYFKTHPEWFSLVDGQRTLVGRYKRTQLCLTNEEMIQQAIRTVKEWIRDHPEATTVSVSQNDGPGGWCECDKCAALETSEGGAHSAPVIQFVNRIAEAIAVEHPKIAIDTLAYSYTSQAPRQLKPLPNVIVRITTGACGSHAIANEKCDKNASLRDNIREWFRLTKRIYIWDYVVNFRQYLLPFPNYDTLAPNLQFFVDHGVRGVFEQGSGDVLHSDMAPLKAYLLAKLLWDPHYDVQKAIDEFLDAYYGPAAKPIADYLNALRQEVADPDFRRMHMIPFEPGIDAAYLTPEILARAMRDFDEAGRLVAGDPEKRQRVEVARLALGYVKLSIASRLLPLVSPTEGQALRDWYRNAVENFFASAQRNGVTHIREAGRNESSMGDFRRLLESGLRLKEGSGADIE